MNGSHRAKEKKRFEPRSHKDAKVREGMVEGLAFCLRRNNYTALGKGEKRKKFARPHRDCDISILGSLIDKSVQSLLSA